MSKSVLVWSGCLTAVVMAMFVFVGLVNGGYGSALIKAASSQTQSPAAASTPASTSTSLSSQTPLDNQTTPNNQTPLGQTPLGGETLPNNQTTTQNAPPSYVFGGEREHHEGRRGYYGDD